MTRKADLVRSGMHATTADAVVGSVATGLTAAGSAHTDALALAADINVVGTTAASTGVKLMTKLSLGDEVVVVNLGANALAVYPPTGGTINGGSANAALSVAAGKTGRFICTASPLTFVGSVSA